HGAGILAILGMHALQVRLEARLEASGVEAVDAVELLRPDQAAARRVPFPGAEAGDLLRFGEQQALLAQRLLGEAPVGDVGRHRADAADRARGVEHRELGHHADALAAAVAPAILVLRALAAA